MKNKMVMWAARDMDKSPRPIWYSLFFGAERPVMDGPSGRWMECGEDGKSRSPVIVRASHFGKIGPGKIIKIVARLESTGVQRTLCPDWFSNAGESKRRRVRL